MVQAPPTRARLSSTSTRLPARARYAAQARPLWPGSDDNHIPAPRRPIHGPERAIQFRRRTAAVGEITALVSIETRQVGKQAIIAQTSTIARRREK